MHALNFSSLIAAALLAPDSGPTPQEIPIILYHEELPSLPVDHIVLGGRSPDGDFTFQLTVQKSATPSVGTAIRLVVGKRRFKEVSLVDLPFESIDFGSITTRWRIYPDRPIFRVRLRYGEAAPHCQKGDDGRGMVAITYDDPMTPEVEHDAPRTC